MARYKAEQAALKAAALGIDDGSAGSLKPEAPKDGVIKGLSGSDILDVEAGLEKQTPTSSESQATDVAASVAGAATSSDQTGAASFAGVTALGDPMGRGGEDDLLRQRRLAPDMQDQHR